MKFLDYFERKKEEKYQKLISLGFSEMNSEEIIERTSGLLNIIDYLILRERLKMINAHSSPEKIKEIKSDLEDRFL